MPSSWRLGLRDAAPDVYITLWGPTLIIKYHGSPAPGRSSENMLGLMLAASLRLAPRLVPPPVMLLRDQAGSGRANDFRFDAYGGNDPTGRYNSRVIHGKGHNAGSRTWVERGGWSQSSESRQSATLPAQSETVGKVVPLADPTQVAPAAFAPAPADESAAKAAWLAKLDDPAPWVGMEGMAVPSAAPAVQPVPAAASRGVVRQQRRLQAPDEDGADGRWQFRHGVGRMADLRPPTTVWRTGGA